MQTTGQTILLAEEDDATRRFLADNLIADSYRVLVAYDRAKAFALLSVNQPDLIVIDVNGHTLEVLDAVRSGEGLAGLADPDTPMIVLSAWADRLHRIRVLERGGDDIVQKPFSYPELRARIVSLLRRAERRRAPQSLAVGSLRIDLTSREVRVADRPVALSRKEYELLLTLAGEPARVFTREELLRSVWGYPRDARTRTLDSHAYRLRRKLSGEGGEKFVSTVWGIGYRLCESAGVR
jgi:DNA-binding response OmpR family regulator